MTNAIKIGSFTLKNNKDYDIYRLDGVVCLSEKMVRTHVSRAGNSISASHHDFEYLYVQTPSGHEIAIHLKKHSMFHAESRIRLVYLQKQGMGIVEDEPYMMINLDSGKSQLVHTPKIFRIGTGYWGWLFIFSLIGIEGTHGLSVFAGAFFAWKAISQEITFHKLENMVRELSMQ